jgi:hypothetical protein
MTEAPSPHGTLAVILFSIGIVLFVLLIIIALLYLQKRRRERTRESTMLAGTEFMPGLGGGGRKGAYAQLEEEWSADMEDGHRAGERVGAGGGERGRGIYEQVR